tara:strand:+ start:986 stop:2245 length:1260 start_codon:yes stop_codon:yes gene_type:complete
MNSFCPNFFNHVMNDSYGVYKACCLHVPERNNGKVEGITVDQPLESFWNSKELAEDRVKSIKGEYVKGCDVCYEAEKDGGASLRTDLVDTYKGNKEFIDRVQNALKNNGILDSSPISVEYRVGNLCNLKCRMCSPQDSDLINNEYKEITSTLTSNSLINLFPTLDEPINVNMDQYCTHIKENVKDIEIIRFSGGEPLINKSFYELIDFFIESKHAPNLDLRINTNLTKINLELLNKFTTFKNVNIDFSIDGIEDTYEYVRYPMRWSVINKKINILEEFIKHNKNINVYANFTVQIYNLIHMLDAIDFFLDRNFTPVLHPVTNPQYLNIKNIPEALKVKVVSMINDKVEFLKVSYTNIPGSRKKWLINKLKSLITLIKIDSEENSIRDFVKFTDILDEKRNQNFLELDPFIYNHFKLKSI